MSITCPSNESNVRGKSANKERGTTVIVGKGSNDLVLGGQGGNYEIMKSTCNPLPHVDYGGSIVGCLREDQRLRGLMRGLG